MIYYHNSNYPEIIRFRQEFFKKQNNNKNNKISILRPLYNSYYLQIVVVFFIFSSSIIILFFRLRTQLIAGSLISLFFLLFTIIFMMKKWYQILHFIHYYKTPFHRYRPPYNQLFLHEKTCFITQYHYCYFSHFVLQKQNKTKKHTWRKKTLMTTFSYMNKTTKVILLSTFVYYFSRTYSILLVRKCSIWHLIKICNFVTISKNFIFD